jgi:hypothetical protein
VVCAKALTVVSREAIAAAALNFENLQASAQAGVSQVRIKHSPSKQKDFEVKPVPRWALFRHTSMPGDFLPRREACQITTSPIFLMGPELETTGVKLRLHNVTLQITPLCTPGAWTLDARRHEVVDL